jgi:small subunit ribosomal protein S21
MTIKGRKVLVTDGNIEKALRKLKKKVTDLGVLQEVKERMEFVKPTIKRKTKKSKAVHRWKKYIEAQQLPPKEF